MKIKALLTLLLVTLISLSSIQLAIGQNMEAVLEAGEEDANTYLNAYAQPGILAFTNGLANGWYNTAKPHKLLGVDFTVSFNMVEIPDEEKIFDFNQQAWENLEIESGDPILPTIAGGETSTVLRVPAGVDLGGGFTYDASQTFNAINGIGDEDRLGGRVLAPTFQLGIGLIKNTDLKIRYLPDLAVGDLSTSFFGIGVMHDIKQWIPGMKLVPIDISAFIGYTNLTADYDIEVNESNFQGQGTATFSATGTTAQIVASKKLAIFTPYIGVGFNAVSSSLDLTGEYTLTNDTGGELTFTDPIDLDFTGGGGPRVTVGGRLKLLILTFHAAYTAQQYNTFTAGFGLSIR